MLGQVGAAKGWSAYWSRRWAVMWLFCQNSRIYTHTHILILTLVHPAHTHTYKKYKYTQLYMHTCNSGFSHAFWRPGKILQSGFPLHIDKMHSVAQCFLFWSWHYFDITNFAWSHMGLRPQGWKNTAVAHSILHLLIILLVLHLNLTLTLPWPSYHILKISDHSSEIPLRTW